MKNKLRLNIQLFAYQRKDWKDKPDLTTPIRAADLNNLERSAEAQDIVIARILVSLGLDDDTWQAGKSYAVGDKVIKDYQIQECTTANSDTTFNQSHWNVLSLLVPDNDTSSAKENTISEEE